MSSKSSFYTTTATPDEMVSVATSAANAATSEANASTSASNAATSETNASNSATAAANSATSASNSASTATTQATTATTQATTATSQASSASTSATSASNSATSATNSATSATNSASTATTKASEASTSASNASTSESNASTSATNASNSASTATTKASEASTSETNASNSATAAASSATSASSSASTATTKASEASTSATNASTSETNASNSASTATTKASEASTSATNASNSATASANSATASANSATAAANSASSIGDLDSLSDVTITSVADNEVLAYDNSSSKFINQTAAEAGLLTGNETITLSGDVSGSGTTSISVTIADDSHNHTIANVDNLQTSLDAKSTATKTETLTNKTFDVEGTGNSISNIDVADLKTGVLDTNLSSVSGSDDTLASAKAIKAYADTKLSANETITLSGDVSGSGTTSIAVTISDDSHNHTIANVDNLQTTLDAKAPLASPDLTGNPTAPTQSASDNSTKIATTAYTDTAISNLVDSSPGALNTLNELAAALGDDANFSTTVTNSLATKSTASKTETLTNKTFDVEGTGNSISNIDVADLKSGVLDTDISSVSGSDDTLASAKAIKTYADTKLSANQTITLSGDVSGSGTTSIAVTIADDSHNHTIANVDNLQTSLDAKAPLASPSLTGTPVAPTASGGTNTTQIATTAFVTSANSNKATKGFATAMAIAL